LLQYTILVSIILYHKTSCSLPLFFFPLAAPSCPFLFPWSVCAGPRFFHGVIIVFVGSA
jgi:hypothetical protein